jgi:hypothetical protein
MTCRGVALSAVILVASVLAAALARPAAAHETTRSFVTVARDGRAIEARVRLAFRDIEVAVWMDEDLDGRITWGETRRRLDAIGAYVRSGLAVQADGRCNLGRVNAHPSESGGVAYLDLQFQARCPSASAPLTVRSRLLTEIDPDHRMFVQASVGGRTTSTLLSPQSPSAEFAGDTGGAAASFIAYFREGIGHMLSGTDHLIFLLALTLPAISALGGPRRAALGVLAAVTGFTAAHALTLSAAATELLRPPTALIEVLIALSIVVTAADNVRPFIPAPRSGIAAFFGLIHGFGFATALGALELTGGGVALALVGFNLGLETAQVAVVLVAVPLLYILGGGRLTLWLGSTAAGTVGLWWVFARLPMVFG